MATTPELSLGDLSPSITLPCTGCQQRGQPTMKAASCAGRLDSACCAEMQRHMPKVNSKGGIQFTILRAPFAFSHCTISFLYQLIFGM